MKGLVGAALMVSVTLLKLVPFEIFHVPVRKISCFNCMQGQIFMHFDLKGDFFLLN